MNLIAQGVIQLKKNTYKKLNNQKHKDKHSTKASHTILLVNKHAILFD